MGYNGEFESDEERALVHIPMTMRYRLDQSGIKLTLKQWQSFPMALRRRVLELPCDTPASIHDFQLELCGLVKGLLDEDVTHFGVIHPLAWRGATVPGDLAQALRDSNCESIAENTWRDLSDFQRYVLLAFARPGRVSTRLPRALEEFCGIDHPISSNQGDLHSGPAQTSGSKNEPAIAN